MEVIFMCAKFRSGLWQVRTVQLGKLKVGPKYAFNNTKLI